MSRKILGVAIVSALTASMSGCFFSPMDGQGLSSKTEAVPLLGFSPVQNSTAIFTCERNGVIYVLHGATANTTYQAPNWYGPVYGNSSQYNKALPAGCWKLNLYNNTTVLKMLTVGSDGSFTPQFTYNNAGRTCLGQSTPYAWETANRGGKIDMVWRGAYCQTGTAVNLSAPL